MQVLQPRFDPTFSEHSYGFRPGRRAHDAVRAAQRYVQEGRRWVVDVDLEKFFDRVNHDVLMGRLAKRIADKRVLGLIRRYLEAGIMANGVVMERHEGTPQGGPLSPLLANVLLDEVDKELEKRGHAFVRYADDCNVYVRSQAGGRARDADAAAAVRAAPAPDQRGEERGGAGRGTASSWATASGWPGAARSNGAWRQQGPCGDEGAGAGASRAGVGGRSIAHGRGGAARRTCVGWKEYFRLAETPRVFRDLDEWIRHRLRAVQLKQWKRGPTVFRELRARGVPERVSRAGGRPRPPLVDGRPATRRSTSPCPTRYFDQLGVPRLAA